MLLNSNINQNILDTISYILPDLEQVKKCDCGYFLKCFSLKNTSKN